MITNSIKAAAVGLVLLTSGAAMATITTTAPFPGFSVNAGSARCTATNVGTKDGVVTLELLDTGGTVLGTNAAVDLPAGRSTTTLAVDLAASEVVSAVE